MFGQTPACSLKVKEEMKVGMGAANRLVLATGGEGKTPTITCFIKEIHDLCCRPVNPYWCITGR